MLDKLRENKGGVITYIFLGAIIFMFVAYFGPGSFDKGCRASNAAPWAAQVNGIEIPASDFQRAYEQLLRRYQAQFGQSFSRDMAEKLGLPSTAVNQLVERALLLEEARRQGLTIPDEELLQTITSLPSFQVDGRFDKEAYQRTVASNYGSTAHFEQVMREDMLVQRLLAGVRETVKVSDAEVKEAWNQEHDSATLAFVRFPLAAAEAEAKPPTEAEATAFAQKESARLEAVYKEQASRFDQPRKVKARHLVVKVAPGATPAEEAAARTRIENLAARIAKGEDFAAVAAQASDDENTKERGGDLGIISEGLVEKAFADALFALPAGAVSPPIRTAAGFALAKAEVVFPAKKVTFEQARAELAREVLLKDRAKALAAERAAAALAAAKAGKSLGDLFPTAEQAKKAGRAVVKLGRADVVADSTGPFDASAPQVPRLGAAPEVMAAAFAATAGQPLPKVFDTPQGPVVAVATAREKPDPAKFDAQKGAVAERLRGRRAMAVEAAWMRSLRDAASVKINPSLGAVAAADAG